MNCMNCSANTENPKFCGRSCAASYNNRLHPKRKMESLCGRCEKPCTRSRTYCRSCWAVVKAEDSAENWERCTLADMRGKGNANAGGRYPYIRSLSRRKYVLAGLPMACKVCGYDFHVDIAHVKEIKSFSENTFISEINDLENLVALCKNHHWELDHGALALSS